MNPESKPKSHLRNQPSFDLIQEGNEPPSPKPGFHLLDALEEGFFSDFSIVTNDGHEVNIVMSIFEFKCNILNNSLFIKYENRSYLPLKS